MRHVAGCGDIYRNLQAEEDKHLGPDAGTLRGSIDAERFERRQDNQDGRPTVVKRERKMDKDLVSGALRLVVLFDNVIDMLLSNTQ